MPFLSTTVFSRSTIHDDLGKAENERADRGKFFFIMWCLNILWGKLSTAGEVGWWWETRSGVRKRIHSHQPCPMAPNSTAFPKRGENFATSQQRFSTWNILLQSACTIKLLFNIFSRSIWAASRVHSSANWCNKRENPSTSSLNFYFCLCVCVCVCVYVSLHSLSSSLKAIKIEFKTLKFNLTRPASSLPSNLSLCQHSSVNLR